MTERAQECAAYFHGNPGYKRMLDAFCKKYQGLGRVGGSVCLRDATEEECEAARLLFGCSFRAPLTLSLKKFEDALQETIFRGVTLPMLLEAYYGRKLTTKQEAHAARADAIWQAICEAGSNLSSERCLRWLTALAQEHADGYALLQKAPDTAMLPLTHACRGVEWLDTHPNQTTRLAVLSAHATSDPHALDGDRLAGKLLVRLLAFSEGQKTPKSAEQRDALFYRNHILCDSISSTVTQTGLVLFSENREGAEAAEHPAFRAFRERKEICTLSLTNLASLRAAYSPSGRAYLVENQMVFTQLCEEAERFHSPLICTSGQLQVAVLRLLDLLEASGTALYYSGDFDPEGLEIAAFLLRRYPQNLKLWHFSPNDYLICRSKERLEASRLKLLERLDNTPLAPAANALHGQEAAGYQELLLPMLLKDLTETP